MPFDTWELSRDRYLEGMVRCGRVTKVRTNPSVAATVTYPDRGFQTAYLVTLQRNTVGYQDYYVPVQGEPVWVLMHGKSLSRGLILGSAYTEGNAPPFNSLTMRGMMYPDGSYVVYDTAGGGVYQMSLKGQMTVAAQNNITITSQTQISCNGVLIDKNGNMTVPGTLTVKGVSLLQAGGTASPNMKNNDGSGGGT